MTAPITFVLGCTGCGKGALGRELASRVGGEIVSIDSMKVYRRMDIGTAKPTAAQRAAVPHHLIDVSEPSEAFSVAQYVDRADAAIADIRGRGRPVFVVGGTPLYVKALLEGLFEGPGADETVRARLKSEVDSIGAAALHGRLTEVDPQAAARIHPKDLRRVVRALEVFELTGKPISSLQAQWNRQRRYPATLLTLRRSREAQSQRTNERVRRMIEAGLVEEVRSLTSEPLPLSTTARKAVGYAEIIQHLEGSVSLAEAMEMIKINTRRLAKSQRTWFKRFADVTWVDVGADDTVPSVADDLMTRFETLWSRSPK